MHGENPKLNYIIISIITSEVSSVRGRVTVYCTDRE